MAELQTIIRSAAAELGDKVAELQRQDKLVRDLQAQQVTAARDNSLCPDMFYFLNLDEVFTTAFSWYKGPKDLRH